MAQAHAHLRLLLQLRVIEVVKSCHAAGAVGQLQVKAAQLLAASEGLLLLLPGSCPAPAGALVRTGQQRRRLCRRKIVRHEPRRPR